MTDDTENLSCAYLLTYIFLRCFNVLAIVNNASVNISFLISAFFFFFAKLLDHLVVVL